MSKSIEEMATEMTTAYIHACGEAAKSGKFNGSWLETNSITSTYDAIYKQIYKSIIDQSNNEQSE